MPGTNPLSPLPNVPHEDQYTVQTSLAVLKTNLPPSYFTPHLAIITDGKAVGEAIRMTGAQMVYVRFPVNETGYPVSFSIPKAFLIPLTVRPLVKPLAGTVQLGGSYSSPVPGAIGGSSFAGVGGSSFANHAHVDLGFHLGEKGEPALCVVCGRWDVEETGKKRSSGHKCKSCIGQKSLERLRKEFERLIDSADVPIPQEDFLRLVDDPNQLPSYEKGGAPPSPHMGPMGAASPQQSPEATLQDDVLET